LQLAHHSVQSLFATVVHGHFAASARSEVRFKAGGALPTHLSRVFVHGEAAGDAEEERSRAQLRCCGAAHRHVRGSEWTDVVVQLALQQCSSVTKEMQERTGWLGTPELDDGK